MPNEVDYSWGGVGNITRRDLPIPESFEKPQPGKTYKLRGQRVRILEVLDEKLVLVTTGDVFTAKKSDLKAE